MKTIAQLSINFLLNAIWQVTAIALAAALANYLLRSVTRFRHVLWVAALVMSLCLPLFSAISSLPRDAVASANEPTAVVEAVVVPANIAASNLPAKVMSNSSAIHVSERIAEIVLVAFLILLVYRAATLFRAWLKTRAIRRTASAFELSSELQAVLDRCESALRVANVEILTSPVLESAATVGIRKPLVILPEELVATGDVNELTAAIGHELVHVARRDYLMNLIYEVIFLPLSFHPAAALMKRQITKTRELRCDELVAERLLHHEAYARSLVRLASWALPATRRAQTIIVGIADADILEVRVMSLLKQTKSNTRRKGFLIFAAALVLAISGVAAAAFAFHFDVDTALASSAQEPSAEAQQKKRRAEEQLETKKNYEAEIQELRQKISETTDAEIKTKLERQLQDAEKGYAWTTNGGGYVMLRVDTEGQRREREMQAKHNSILAGLAKISMDQAIQIATSKTPGKVLECSLVGERWSEPGELAKPNQVLYHVVILSGDETNPITTHVMVNAVDGSIVTINNEGKRENELMLMQQRKAIQGGVLNGKAISLPVPEYPDIARQAKAAGTVTVQVMIDETGHVIEARAVSGHPLLQSAAVAAARQAIFQPTRVEGEPVKVGGAVVYNFVPQ